MYPNQIAGPMPGHPQQPQGYPAQQQPQYPAPAAAMPPAPAGGDPFVDSDPTKKVITFVTKPTLRVLGMGRTVIIVPKELHRDTPNQFFEVNKPEDRRNTRLRTYALCDVIICDGQPFLYGGNGKEKPDMLGPFPVPGVIFDMEIDRKPILDDIEPWKYGAGLVIARLNKTRGKNAPEPYWVIDKVDEAVKAASRPLWEAYKAGRLPTHVPPPPVEQPAQGYTGGYPAGQAPQATPGNFAFPPMGGQATPINPAQPQWPQPQPTTYPAQPQWPTSPAQYPPPINPAPYGQPDPRAQQTPISAPAAPADVPVPGHEGAWPTYSEQQKQMVRAHAAQQAAAAAPSYP